MPDNLNRILLLVTPPLLIVTTVGAFRMFARFLGPKTGYLAGFGFYWLFWCVALPMVVLGRDGVAAIFQRVRHPFGRPAWLGALGLILPLGLGYGYAFPRAIAGATPVAVLVSAALALVNGPLEELLWRGTYAVTFGSSKLFGWVYPTLGFALWHLAPLSVFPNRAPGGNVSFILAASVIGLFYGWVATQTRSIRYTTIAHVLFDFSGLGGRIFLG